MALRLALAAVVSLEPILVLDNPAMKMATSVTWIRVTMMVCAKRMKIATIARPIALRASRPVAEMAFANHRQVKIVFPALPIAAENNQDPPKIVSVAEMVMESILSAAAITVAHRKVLHAALNHLLLTVAVISFVRAQKPVVIAGSTVQASVIPHQHATMMGFANRAKTATLAAMIARDAPVANLHNGIVVVMASSNQLKVTERSATEIIRTTAKAPRRQGGFKISLLGLWNDADIRFGRFPT